MSARVRNLAVILAVVSTAAGVLTASSTGNEAPASLGGAAGSPDIEFSQGVSWVGERLSSRAALLGSEVPVPRGSNFNGIRWNELGAGTDGDIRFLLQYNAACQWLRHAVSVPADPFTAEIWAEIPQWPAMRLSGHGDAFVAAYDEVRAGHIEGSLLAQCVEAHEREVTYARRAGVAPPL